MATPLGELLRQLRDDTDVHARFQQSPAEYLHEHGWGDLDAADMQEALLLLADAAPAAEASGWIAAGEAIDTDANDAAAAFDAAIGTLHDDIGDVAHGDTDALDEIQVDGIGQSDPGDLDGIPAIDHDPTEPTEPVGDQSPAVAAASPESDTVDEQVAEIDDDRDATNEIGDEPVDDFDPTAPDTPAHADTPLTEDPTDAMVHDLDPEPDWDDPS